MLAMLSALGAIALQWAPRGSTSLASAPATPHPDSRPGAPRASSRPAKAGADFRAARRTAEDIGATVVLGDRPIEITIERSWRYSVWLQAV